MTTDQPPAPWRCLAPRGTLHLEVPLGVLRRRALLAELGALPPGASVVLLDARPLARRRCRGLARRSGLVVQREVLALPSLVRSVYLVEDDPVSVRFAWRNLLTAPPGVTRAHAAVSSLLALGASLPWWVLGTVAPGRVVVAGRP